MAVFLGVVISTGAAAGPALAPPRPCRPGAERNTTAGRATQADGPHVSSHPGRWALPANVGSDADSDSVEARHHFMVPSTPWDAATGWTGRVVVSELTTGVWCGPCWWHQREFEALLRRYPSTVFIGLVYHTLAGPFLVESDSLWQRFNTVYGGVIWGDSITRLTMGRADVGLFPPDTGKYNPWIDGHGAGNWSQEAVKDLIGPHGDLDVWGEMQHAKRDYADYVRMIDAELHRAPEAVLHTQATPHGGTLSTQVTVTSLAPGHPDVYVRIVLVEDTVHLVLGTQPLNIRPDYYMIVRDFARSTQFPLGIPLHGPGTVNYTFDVAKVQQERIREYRQYIADQREWETEHRKSHIIIDPRVLDILPPNANTYRINPARLHVVVYVQDARTGDVLQAQMIPVSTGPHGAKLQLPPVVP